MLVPWLLTLTILLLLLHGQGVACEERVWYLDPQAGSDANDCHTEQTACKSVTRLQEILNQAQPGTVIRLKRGTTMQPTTRIDLKVSGTETAPIILEAYGEGALPILDGSQVPGGNMILQGKRLAWYIIRDWQFQYGKGAIMLLGCSDFVLERLAMKERCEQECLHLKHDGPDAISQRITVRHSVMDVERRDEGIYIGTDPAQDGGVPDLSRDIVIESNVFRGGSSHECIEMKDGTSAVTIAGNQFVQIALTQNGCVFSARARHETPPGNHRIEGNTFYDLSGSDGYAIRVRNDAVVRGNVIHTTSKTGIAVEQPSGNPVYQRTVEYNTILYAAEAGILAQGGGNTVQHNIVWNSGSGNESADPQFVNMAAGDFRLKPGSPATLRGAFPTPAPTGASR